MRPEQEFFGIISFLLVDFELFLPGVTKGFFEETIQVLKNLHLQHPLANLGMRARKATLHL